MYYITTQDQGKDYFYRSTGIRWVTKQDKAQQFSLTEVAHYVQVILDINPSQSISIVPA